MSDPLQSLGSSLPGRIAGLEARAKAALSLTEQVRALLPAAVRTHLLSASYREGTLSLTMDSAAWCPQVRYAEAELLAQLNGKGEGGPDFVKLKVRVGRK